MNFKKFIAAAALAACTITATPVKAQQYEAKQIVNYLQRLGVTLNINASSCGSLKTGHGAAGGWYRPVSNQMCIKDHRIIGADAWFRMLNHEAWHVVQDILGDGLQSSKMTPLSTWAYVNQGESSAQRVINKLSGINTYEQVEWAGTYAKRQSSDKFHNLEWEAVLVEYHPGLVLKSLRLACDALPSC